MGEGKDGEGVSDNCVLSTQVGDDEICIYKHTYINTVNTTTSTTTTNNNNNDIRSTVYITKKSLYTSILDEIIYDLICAMAFDKCLNTSILSSSVRKY